jgi:all-trans-retinol 13,14-reductase
MAQTTYGRRAVQGHFDAIVIGSGIGGLSVAALLAMHKGKRVLILERHYTPGGFTHVFRRPGYEWDVGVHYIGEVHDPSSSLRAIFDHLTEGRLRWNPMPEVYERMLFGEREYEFHAGADRFCASMKDYFPTDTGAIDRYVATIRAGARASRLFFASKVIPRVLEGVAGRPMRAWFMRYARLTTAQALRGITANPELAAVLASQWGDYGLPPGSSSFGVHAIVAEHYLKGAAYPVGGASAVLAGILPSVERNGGMLLTSAEVKEISIGPDGRATGVLMADGGRFEAPIVISDAGALNTYLRLLPPSVSHSAGADELQSVASSMAHICLYVGLRHTDAELGIDPANRWIFPGPDHDRNVARSLADANAPLPAVFISFPSAKDPHFSVRYPGRATIEVVAPVPFARFGPWADTRWKHRGAEYDELKGALTEQLRTALETHVPQVRGKIDYCELSTPLSTRHFTNFQHGEIYGLSAMPQRFALRSLGPRTRVPGLYLTGADAAIPGVSGAMIGGVLTASAILGRNMTRVTLSRSTSADAGRWLAARTGDDGIPSEVV